MCVAFEQEGRLVLSAGLSLSLSSSPIRLGTILPHCTHNEIQIDTLALVPVLTWAPIQSCLSSTEINRTS